MMRLMSRNRPLKSCGLQFCFVCLFVGGLFVCLFCFVSLFLFCFFVFVLFVFLFFSLYELLHLPDTDNFTVDNTILALS